MHINIEGNHVYLIFDFTTGEASGQNMVTHRHRGDLRVHRGACPGETDILRSSRRTMSGDKKASLQSFLLVRGRSVTCEASCRQRSSRSACTRRRRGWSNYWRMWAMGGVLSGTIGVQGHYANGLAALYLACGQDVACVAESAVGVTRFEVTSGGDLYAAVTLPNLMVGTVGGGTALPTQRACLDILGLSGTGSANAFAEVAPRSR